MILFILYMVGVILAAASMNALKMYDDYDENSFVLTLLCIFSFFTMFVCLLTNLMLRLNEFDDNPPTQWFDFKLLKV